MRPRVLLFALLFALVVAYSVADFALLFPQSAAIEGRGWGTRQSERDAPVQVLEVNTGGPAGGSLRVGDEVVSLNGEDVSRSDLALERAFIRIGPGEDYTLGVRRDGQAHEFTLRAERPPASAKLFETRTLLTILGGLVFLLVGLAVFVLKPDDKQAVVLAVCMTVYGGAWPLAFPFGDAPRWVFVLIASGHVLKTFVTPLMLHLFLIFPRPLPLVRRFPRLELYAYLPALLVGLPGSLYYHYLWLADPEGWAFFTAEHPTLDFFNAATGLACMLGCLVAAVLQYRAADAVSKRKLRLVLAAFLVSVGPLFLLLLFNSLTGLSQRDPVLYSRIFAFVIAPQPLLPLAFAYAIVRHQVIPVSLIVRRSIQYLLAKNALRLLLLLPVAGLVLSVALDPHRSVADILLRNSTFFYFLLIAAVATGLVFRRRLNEWVDRKFFREQYDQEKILRGLVDEIKGLDSMPEMSRRVSGEVERALHPESVYLFYRESAAGEMSLTYTSGGEGRGLSIPEDFQLLRLLELQGGAQDFPFPPKTNLPQHEKDWLRSLGTRLIVPLSGTDDRLAGLFLLGQKKSEVPYTARDRELLEAVAGQVALVYENVRLKERARENRRVQDEVLSRFEGRGVNLLKECPRCGRCFDSTAARCTDDGAELQMTLPVERTVEGRYRLERLIGRGGMGAVYEATHLKLQHRVAVKVLGGRLFGDQRALRRFEREARALARLGQHPNVVSVHDYGELRTEGAFLVMDFIEGESLAALLKRERRLRPARAAGLFEQVLEAVGAAHAAGIVHRDLKPENILVSDDAAGRGRVRVLDFGLAKLVGSEGGEAQTMTQPGMVMGTLGYMAPEQLQGEETDERTDLFSIGVMAAEALTGRRPFAGRTLFELLRSIEREDFRLPGETAETRRLEEVLRRCLARQRQRRPASAEELRRDLIDALRACAPDALYEEEPLDADTFILPNAPPPASV
ncbi:MAG TPA: protein kinase [Pyrinomonadaceae bacterium]|nr:protein kinase [Pyrinomonadaceae bacterium]